MFCSCLLCRVAYFHVFPTAALCFLRVRAQSLERLTPSRRLGENSHQIETLRTGLRWNVWGQFTHHILDPRNCSPWYYRSIAGCKTSNIKRRQLQLNDFFWKVPIEYLVKLLRMFLTRSIHLGIPDEPNYNVLLSWCPILSLLNINSKLHGRKILKTQSKCDHEINFPCGCGQRLVNLQIVCWNLKLT